MLYCMKKRDQSNIENDEQEKTADKTACHSGYECQSCGILCPECGFSAERIVSDMIFRYIAMTKTESLRTE